MDQGFCGVTLCPNCATDGDLAGDEPDTCDVIEWIRLATTGLCESDSYLVLYTRVTHPEII